MVEKICLDTDACIFILKNDKKALELKPIIENSEVFVSTVTVFELLLRKTNLNIAEDFIKNFFQLPFDSMIARKASELYKELSANGEIIDMRDLFIASTCLVHNLPLLTFNIKHFEKIKNLNLVKIAS